MTFQKRIFFFTLAGLLALILAGCNVSLASDVTPPPNAESYTAQDTKVATQSIFPIVPPDPKNGEAIFAEKCAPCHGPDGMGNGTQSSDLPVTVPALGDFTLAAAARPVDWYNMVTNGNMESYMPAFKSLDDRQRWDVVAYALSLSIPEGVVSAGKQVYEANCLACHGEQGTGVEGAPNWQVESGRLAQLSLEEIVDVTANGAGAMPGFIDTLSNDKILSVAYYVRSLSFASAGEETAFVTTPAATEPVVPPQTTSIPAGTAETFPPQNLPDSQATPAATVEPTPAAAAATITVTGKLTAAPGIEIPTGLTATLYGFDDMNQVYEAQTDLAADGSFQFDNVEFASGRAYMAIIEYQGLTFNSDVYHGEDTLTETTIDLPITYYQTTSDLSLLRADRMHVFFDFSRSGVVQVVELFILNNTGNEAIVSANPGEGVIEFALPEGAANLQFQDGTLGDRYLETDKGFADTATIPPGEGTQILFAYDLPYERKTNIAIPVPMPVDAAIFMVPSGAIKLTSDLLQSTGARDVQGITLDMYSGSNFEAGSVLDVTLSGRVSTTPTLEKGDTTSLLIGGGVLGLVLIGAGYWLWRSNKKDEDEEDVEVMVNPETAEEIMDAIITLDDRYKAGDLPEEAYQARRAELKAKLEAIIK